MQASQHRFRKHDCTHRQSMLGRGLRKYRRFLRRIRYAGPERAVATSSVVMGSPLFQKHTKMRLRDWNHPIQAFPSNRPDHALTDRVCLRTPYR